jgi:hypothetical protein
MSLIFFDNFSIYGGDTGKLADGIYAAVAIDGIVTDPDITATGQVIKMGIFEAAPYVLRYVLPGGNSDKVGIALRLWLASVPANFAEIPEIMHWNNSLNNTIASLSVNTVGGLTFSLGGKEGTVLGESSGPVLTANAWNHIEAYIDSSGNAEARVNGATVATVTGAAFEAIAQVQHVGQGTNFSGLKWYIKDLIYWDDSGSQNNNFLGSCQVLDLTPMSDDVFSGWTLSAGSTAWTILDDAPPDNANYIAADNTLPAATVHGLTNLPPDVTSVKGVMTMVRAQKEDGGDGQLQNGVVSGSSTGLGTDRPITTAPTYWYDIFQLDPATSLPWTPGAVDAAKLTLHRTL